MTRLFSSMIKPSEDERIWGGGMEEVIFDSQTVSSHQKHIINRVQCCNQMKFIIQLL